MPLSYAPTPNEKAADVTLANKFRRTPPFSNGQGREASKNGNRKNTTGNPNESIGNKYGEGRLGPKLPFPRNQSEKWFSKSPIKVGKRPIQGGKRPIKAMVLVGISVGCFMGCFLAPSPWRKTAPLKRPIEGSMIKDTIFVVFLRYQQWP